MPSTEENHDHDLPRHTRRRLGHHHRWILWTVNVKIRKTKGCRYLCVPNSRPSAALVPAHIVPAARTTRHSEEQEATWSTKLSPEERDDIREDVVEEPRSMVDPPRRLAAREAMAWHGMGGWDAGVSALQRGGPKPGPGPGTGAGVGSRTEVAVESKASGRWQARALEGPESSLPSVEPPYTPPTRLSLKPNGVFP
ncbi:hypothetical protein KM043_001797 [Ampulex compressa]|nr:hypothetical protein KM043_001797 [Ampulex compressa]